MTWPSWSRGTWFDFARLTAWAVQVPIALATSLKVSLTYLAFLSLAALIESAFTDLKGSAKADREKRA